MSTVTATYTSDTTLADLTLRLSSKPLSIRLFSLLSTLNTPEINKWREQFDHRYFIDSTNAQERERAALALAFLLIQIVEDTHEEAIGPLRTIISELLDSTAIDDFIINCKEKDIRYRIQQLNQNLNDNREAVNRRIKELYLSIEKLLLQLQEKLEQSVEGQFERLDKVKSELNERLSDLQKLTERFSYIGNAIADEIQYRDALLSSCENILAKV